MIASLDWGANGDTNMNANRNTNIVENGNFEIGKRMWIIVSNKVAIYQTKCKYYVCTNASKGMSWKIPEVTIRIPNEITTCQTRYQKH